MPSLRDEIGDFVGIPISFVEDAEQTAESRVVFMILRYHTNRKRKRAFPGYETIMRETGLSRQKTAAGIKVLTTTGWLVKHKQFAKVTEYELCYPAPAYSSTGELRQEPSLVPPANAVSSTTEQPPLSDNKIEVNKIGRGFPRQPGSDDEQNEKLPLHHYSALKDPSIFPYDVFAMMVDMVGPPLTAPVVREWYPKWWGSRNVNRGIGKPRPRAKSTLPEYFQDFENYLRAVVDHQQNGRSSAGKDEYRGPVQEDPQKRRIRENCPDCHGSNTIPGKPGSVCKHEGVVV